MGSLSRGCRRQFNHFYSPKVKPCAVLLKFYLSNSFGPFNCAGLNKSGSSLTVVWYFYSLFWPNWTLLSPIVHYYYSNVWPTEIFFYLGNRRGYWYQCGPFVFNPVRRSWQQFHRWPCTRCAFHYRPSGPRGTRLLHFTGPGVRSPW